MTRAFCHIIFAVLVCAGCASRPHAKTTPAALPAVEGVCPFARFSWEAPTNGTPKEAVLQFSRDFITWTPVITNQSAVFLNLSGDRGFYRVKWRMK